MTAYALREGIRDVLGHFWSESFGQIYPTLHRLEQQEYVRRRPGSRARSSTYELTPSGTARLRELLTRPITNAPRRNGLLLRLFFGRLLGPDQCRTLLTQARDDARNQLAEYDHLARTLRREDAGSPDLPFALMTLSAGLHAARANALWAEESLRALADLSPPPPDSVREGDLP